MKSSFSFYFSTLMAQPEIGPPQVEFPPAPRRLDAAGSQIQELAAYSLPSKDITENDIDEIEAVVQKVLSRISESQKSAGKRSDYQTIKSGILAFQDWLNSQVCISRVSSTYDLEASDNYSDNIFITSPGQLPLDIVFKMGGGTKQYRMLLFVSSVDFLRLGSLVENRSEKVPVPQNWPKNYMPYFQNRGEK